MKYISICSGIEAASVAWHPLGWEPVAFSEIEPFPCAVLAHHYPSVPNLGDLTKWRDWPAELLAEADVLIGGTPCQAFSVAGLRNSLADDRGNLSLIFVELANAIDNFRRDRNKPPVVILWENVPGVLSVADNAFGCFVGALAGSGAALEPSTYRGWTDAGVVSGPQRAVAWRVLDAQYFRLAQRRRRVFVVASAGDWAVADALHPVREGMRRDSAPRREAGEGVAERAGDGAGSGGEKLICMASGQANAEIDRDLSSALNCNRDGAPIIAPAVYSIMPMNSGKDFKARQVDVAQPLMTSPVGGNQGGDFVVCATGPITHALTAEGHDASEDGTWRGTPVVAFSCKDHGADAAAELSPTLRSMGHDGSHANGGGQVAVAFHPTQDPINSVEVCHALGTGSKGGCATAAVACDVYNQTIDGDVAATVTAQVGVPNHSGPKVLTSVVRRLTPVECERLQGFPDGYTDTPWRNKPTAPDGPRYKALGNSMAVPVIRWLGKQIEEAMA